MTPGDDSEPNDGFEEAYTGAPPWETGQPQPEIVRLAEQSDISGDVLDVGCGTGENALYLTCSTVLTFGLREYSSRT